VGDISDGRGASPPPSQRRTPRLTVLSLHAAATEGRRLVSLQRTGADATPLDEAAFTDLFEQPARAAQDA
jgi:hypothetical protein